MGRTRFPFRGTALTPRALSSQGHRRQTPNFRQQDERPAFPPQGGRCPRKGGSVPGLGWGSQAVCHSGLTGLPWAPGHFPLDAQSGGRRCPVMGTGGVDGATWWLCARLNPYHRWDPEVLRVLQGLGLSQPGHWRPQGPTVLHRQLPGSPAALWGLALQGGQESRSTSSRLRAVPALHPHTHLDSGRQDPRLAGLGSLEARSGVCRGSPCVKSASAAECVCSRASQSRLHVGSRGCWTLAWQGPHGTGGTP